uniref:Ig-like domain-containing protein n=1 Tax=Hucho hucho TaxID=62062 RepID=A0A4W5PCL1_9TELE
CNVLVTSNCVSVVQGQYGWSVTFTTPSICALKGSTVDISCSYTYPSGHTVTTLVWYYWNGWRFVQIQSNNEGRVEYHQTTEKDSTLRITDLRESDKETYYFRYKTDKSDWKTAQRGVTVSVTELQVEVTGSSYVKTLTCRTTCTLPGNPTYIWYKNRQYLEERTSPIYSNYVYSKDAGSYSCAVKEHEDLSSPAVCVHNSNCWSVTYAKRRICVLKGSRSFNNVHPDPNSDTYTPLNMRTRSLQYDTLASVRDVPSDTDPQRDAQPSNYENLRDPGLNKTTIEIGLKRTKTEPGLKKNTTEPGLKRTETELGLKRTKTDPGLKKTTTEPRLKRTETELGLKSYSIKPKPGLTPLFSCYHIAIILLSYPECFP